MESASFEIPVSLKQQITSEQAYHYRILPYKEVDGNLVLKTDQEDLPLLQQELQIVLGKDIMLERFSVEEIEKGLSLYYRKTNVEEVEDFSYETNFLKKLIGAAQDFGSSDIHIEPLEKEARIRFRLDGKLKTQYTISKDEYPQLVNQIKIQSGLDIAQKRLSQDGRILFKSERHEFDIRVSSMPTLHGEKMVLRLLSRNTSAISLDELGFTKEELVAYREATKNTQGIILISGPTGSGKTTTLYATLKELNKEVSNVLTIEDPIEYTLEGINQVQLKEDIGFDFPKALRTFLRQDPDVIMVGEIRDNDTAAMAIKAALTGHLVLSTIHTNSAWGTVSRLIDMKVPSYLLASTLCVSIAQRLIRKLCNNCKVKSKVVASDFPMGFQIPKALNETYKSKGCNQCYHTGFAGRKAIYEILPISKELEMEIKKNSLEIDEYICSQKIQTLKGNALRLVEEGVTSINEVYPILISN